MPSSPSEFLADRVLAGAFAVAFASAIAQAEAYTGDCGLSSSLWHRPLLLAQFCGLVCSVWTLCNFGPKGIMDEWSRLITIIGIYFLTTISTNTPRISSCDYLVLAGGVLRLVGKNRDATKLVLANVLVSVVIGKFSDPHCDASWLSFGSLKSDMLNQPFPFTPVWHLAQLPDTVTEILSFLIAASEFLLPCILVFSKNRSSAEMTSAMGIVILTAFYALIGNFNWSVLVLLSWAIMFIPEDITLLFLGKDLFNRWGLKSISFDEAVAESTLVKLFVSHCKLCLAYIVAYIGFKSLLNGDLSLLLRDSRSFSIGVSILVSVIALYSINKLRASPRHLILGCILLVLSRSEFVSVMTFRHVDSYQDFSTFPTCYTFADSGLDFPSHSRDGRAAFLFQTKYSQLGTNTVGQDLGGTKYAELSVPGSVHADEQRPPFLLGHLPRIALTIWKTGTGRAENIKEGLVLMNRLAQAVRDGSDAMRVFFSNMPDSLLDAHVGKPNQIQAFYQEFTVTSRAADHQWWKRSYDKVRALPPSEVPNPIKKRCTILLPPKILDVPIELVLIVSVMAMLAAKLLFSSPLRSSDMHRKHK